MFERTAIFLLTMLIAPPQSACARPTEIILLRHAEKPADESNPHLSSRGLERARELPKLLAGFLDSTNNGPSGVLIAPHPTARGHSHRCIETLEPTARQLRLPLDTRYAAGDWNKLAGDLRTNHAYDGRAVVVCWVHEDIPALVGALGVKKAPAWSGKTFDRLWIVTYENGKAVLGNAPQHLLPGDSER